MQRAPRPNEVAALENPAKDEVISIVQREESAHYWSHSMMPLDGLFGSVEKRPRPRTISLSTSITIEQISKLSEAAAQVGKERAHHWVGGRELVSNETR